MKKHREEWNRRYREEEDHEVKEPSPFLVEWQPQLPEGRALDVGCGAGRNAIFLADRGYEVDAIDYSKEALKIAQKRARNRELTVNWIHSDVKKHKFPKDYYDVIVVFYFYPENELPVIKDSLKEGGFFIYEQHITTEDEVDRGPSSSRFRFEPNELLKRFSDFQILYYSEGIKTYEDGKKSAIARMAARKTSEFKRDLPPIFSF